MALQRKRDWWIENKTGTRQNSDSQTCRGCPSGATLGGGTSATHIAGAGRVGAEFGQAFFGKDAAAIFKKLRCRYKRIRKRPRKQESQAVYQHKVEILGTLERLSEGEQIELIYTDAARVSGTAVVPYGWQFPDEDVFVPSTQGAGLNCLAFLQRSNQSSFQVQRESINSQFIFEQFEHLSLKLKKLTVVVLDNAPVHTAKIIKERRAVWERSGLFLFYLPRYSPHLNIVEILWRKLKYEWLSPADYETDEGLFYTVRQALAAVGGSLRINFSKFGLA